MSVEAGWTIQIGDSVARGDKIQRSRGSDIGEGCQADPRGLGIF